MRILFILIFLCSTTVYAEVYKRTNPDGSVEFTDVPSKQEEKPVQLSPMSTFKSQSRNLPRNMPPRTTKASAYIYNIARITSPVNEATIRDNSGTIKVNVSISPAVHPDHKLIILVDGTQKGESSTGRFTLTNIDRGTHKLSAQILDKAGKLLVSTLPVTVYLHRQSIIKPKRFVR